MDHTIRPNSYQKSESSEFDIESLTQLYNTESKAKIDTFKAYLSWSYNHNYYKGIRDTLVTSGCSKDVFEGVSALLETGKSDPGSSRRNALSSFNDLKSLISIPEDLPQLLNSREQVIYLDLLSKDLASLSNTLTSQANTISSVLDYCTLKRVSIDTRKPIADLMKKLNNQSAQLQSVRKEIATSLSFSREAYSTYSIGIPKEVNFFEYILEFYTIDEQKQTNMYTLATSFEYNRELDLALEAKGVDPNPITKSQDLRIRTINEIKKRNTPTLLKIWVSLEPKRNKT